MDKKTQKTNTKQIHSHFRAMYGTLEPEYKKVLAGIQHNVSKGDELEETVKNLISQYLPGIYGIDRGFIRSLEKDPDWMSNQIDLIIWDKMNFFPLASYDNIKIFPIEAVIGIIEVTSYLDAKKIKTDFKKALEIKKLKKRSFVKFTPLPNNQVKGEGKIEFDWFQPRFFHFSFNSAWEKTETIAKNILKVYDSMPEVNPNCIYVLNKGAMKAKPKNKPTDKPMIYYLDEPVYGFIDFIMTILRDISTFPTCFEQTKIMIPLENYIYS